MPSFPETIPSVFAANPQTADAYRMGWTHGHGLACQNVPHLGDRPITARLGHVTVTAENIREVHEALCFEAEEKSRSFSPFDFIAHEFNTAPHDDEIDPDDPQATAEELWEAFEAGVDGAIAADVRTYTDADYGIEGANDDT